MDFDSCNSIEYKRRLLLAEIDRLQRLPPQSQYVAHRLRVSYRCLELVDLKTPDDSAILEQLMQSLSLS